MRCKLLYAAIPVACGCLTNDRAEADVAHCRDVGDGSRITGYIGLYGCTSAGTEDMWDWSEYYLIEAAFATWAHQFEEGDEESLIGWKGYKTFYPAWPPQESGNINWAFWAPDSASWEGWAKRPEALAEANVYYSGMHITGCDIVFRDHGINWGDADHIFGYDTHDVQSVMSHELGHCLGLYDVYGTECSGQVMYYDLQRGVQRRQVGLGDEWGFYLLYQGPVLISYFNAVAESAQVRLEWYSTDGTDTGNIYRGGSCWGPFEWLTPFSSNTGENYFIDDTVEYSREYYYLMVTDEGQRKFSHAGPFDLPSYELPDPPASLVAQDVIGDCGGATNLSWSSSPDPDAVGYHIYRTNAFIPVSCNSDVKEYYLGSTFTPQFIDSTAAFGVTYDYFVAAYDSTRAVSDTTNHSVSGSERDLPIIVSPDSSSVEITSVDLSGICPLGDMGKLLISIRVKDQCGWPVWSLPGEDVLAVTGDSPGGPISCLDDTIYASSATNGNGETMIEIPRIGGCGEMTFDVYVDGVLIGRPTIWVTSPDLNADCVVDAADDTLFGQYFVAMNPCADLNGVNGVDLGDFSSFSEHYGAEKYHFCIDADYSSANLTPSSNCLVSCPKGDIESFSNLVIARNAVNTGFPYSSIPADSIWITIPQPDPGEADFRFLCRPDYTKATADAPTWGPEKTTITVNSGGGSSASWDVRTYIGGRKVGFWSGSVKSPDIDASGSVNGSDIGIWSGDAGTAAFRSDLDCSGQVGSEDFDILNAHYKHGCSASSQMTAEGGTGSDSWIEEDAVTIRSHLSDYQLDALLAKELHPELRALLTYARSFVEPEGVVTTVGQVQSAEESPLPRFTSVAQNVPNPFRATAIINYQVASPGGHVEIVIFDAAGRRVRTLVNMPVSPGYYAAPWDGRNDSGRSVPSGVYFYQMKAPGYTSNKRMMLVR